MNFRQFVCMAMIFMTLPLWANASTIHSVRIEGLSYLKGKQRPMSDNLETQAGDMLSQKKLQRDVDWLFSTGYFSNVLVNVSSNRFEKDVVFSVQPYPLIERVEFEGISRFSPFTLLKRMNNIPGNVLNVRQLEEDIQRLEDFYYERGYELFRVKTAYMDENILRIDVSEGMVNTIQLEGLKQTRPFVVRRQLLQKEGKVFNAKLLRKDRLRMLELGYFSDIGAPELNPRAQDDQIDIKYTFTERKINFLDLGLEQLVDEDGVAAFFSIKYHHLFLYSDSISAKTQVLIDDAISLRSYRLRYYQPWLMNLVPMSAAIDLWTEFRKEPFFNETTAIDNVRQGGDLVFGLPIIPDVLSISAKGKIETVSPRKGEEFTPYTINSLSGGLQFRTVDNYNNPRNGEYANFTYEKGGNLGVVDLGGLDFSRWKLDLAKFTPLNERSTLAVRAGVGEYDRSTASSIKTFESEAFPLGGSNSLRGYREFSFVGNQRLLFNVEYRHELAMDIQGVLFYDIGNVFDEGIDLNVSNYKTGRGFGFRYITGLAPFRLDFAWGEEELYVHFNLGQVF